MAALTAVEGATTAADIMEGAATKAAGVIVAAVITIKDIQDTTDPASGWAITVDTATTEVTLTQTATRRLKTQAAT